MYVVEALYLVCGLTGNCHTESGMLEIRYGCNGAAPTLNTVVKQQNPTEHLARILDCYESNTRGHTGIVHAIVPKKQ